MESQQTVRGAGHDFGRCTPTDIQYPEDVGWEETLPGPNSVTGVALCGLDALLYERGVRPVPCQALGAGAVSALRLWGLRARS